MPSVFLELSNVMGDPTQNFSLRGLIRCAHLGHCAVHRVGPISKRGGCPNPCCPSVEGLAALALHSLAVKPASDAFQPHVVPACRRLGCTYLTVELLSSRQHAATLHAAGPCFLTHLAQRLLQPGALLPGGRQLDGVFQLGSKVLLARRGQVHRCMHADCLRQEAQRALLPAISAIEPCCVVVPPQPAAVAEAVAVAEAGNGEAGPDGNAGGASAQPPAEEMAAEGASDGDDSLAEADGVAEPSTGGAGTTGSVRVRVLGRNIAGGSDLPLCRQDGFYQSVEIWQRWSTGSVVQAAAGVGRAAAPGGAAAGGAAVQGQQAAVAGAAAAAAATGAAAAAEDCLDLGLLGLVPGACEVQVQHGVLLAPSQPLLVLPADAEAAAAEVCALAAACARDGRSGASLAAFLRDVGLVVAWLDEQEQGLAAGPGVAGWANHGAADVAAAVRRALVLAEHHGMLALAQLLFPVASQAASQAAPTACLPRVRLVAQSRPAAAGGGGGVVHRAEPQPPAQEEKPTSEFDIAGPSRPALPEKADSTDGAYKPQPALPAAAASFLRPLLPGAGMVLLLFTVLAAVAFGGTLQFVSGAWALVPILLLSLLAATVLAWGLL